jgi:tetratricopeptide (TPR) repeat protein
MKLPTAVMLVVALAPASRAHADAKREAKEHVARATELHKEGAFEKALDELKTAYALDPQPQLLFAMGQLHVRLGRCPEAITYYERFLATRPPRAQARLASEAIQTCKTAPPPVEQPAEPAPVTVAPQPPPPPPEPAVEPVAAVPPVAPPPERRAWYQDYVADGLFVGGIAAGVAAVVVYRTAVNMRDEADAIADYAAYVDQIDAAKSRRNLAIGLGVGGAALFAAGAIHLVVWRGHQDGGVQVAPKEGGGVVSWGGRW